MIQTTNPGNHLQVNRGTTTYGMHLSITSTKNMLKVFGGREVFSFKRTSRCSKWGLAFYTSSVNRMAITAASNVGIGTSSPTAALEVAGNVKFGCPTGITSCGRGCISSVQTGTTAYLAESNCKTALGGTICMYNENMRACAAGVITSYYAGASNNWVGDRQGDDEVEKIRSMSRSKTTNPFGNTYSRCKML